MFFKANLVGIKINTGFTLSKLLIILGVLLLVLGLTLNYAPGLFNWFGKLPGDIHVKNEQSQLFIPVTSMIIISIVLTVIINLFFRK